MTQTQTTPLTDTKIQSLAKQSLRARDRIFKAHGRNSSAHDGRDTEVVRDTEAHLYEHFRRRGGWQTSDEFTANFKAEDCGNFSYHKYATHLPTQSHVSFSTYKEFGILRYQQRATPSIIRQFCEAYALKRESAIWRLIQAELLWQFRKESFVYDNFDLHGLVRFDPDTFLLRFWSHLT